MSLLNQSVQVYGKLDSLFEKLREGQAPEKFNREFLKDLGFKSSNWHATISLLKGLGFLSAEGIPTQKYMEFLDKTQWKQVLAESVRSAYSDIFVMKREPADSDRKMIAGKYKSTYNLSDTVADRAAGTFLALLKLASPDVYDSEKIVQQPADEKLAKGTKKGSSTIDRGDLTRQPSSPVQLNYNIQIHLPPTKDIEVYNAIFKSLKEHIID